MKKIDGTLAKLGTHTEAEIPNTAGDGIRVGTFSKKPTIGESFVLIYKNRFDGLLTSFVTEILEEDDKHIIFKTNNSIYRLDF